MNQEHASKEDFELEEAYKPLVGKTLEEVITEGESDDDKKARKESGKKRKPTNPPQITGFWGRGASPYRPGLFTKRYFEKHGEVYSANIPPSSHKMAFRLLLKNAILASISSAPSS